MDRSWTTWDQRIGGPLLLFDYTTSRRLGPRGLVSIDAPNLVAEAGYWTAPDARGNGAATRGIVFLAE